MAKQITYYAIINELSTREDPWGVFRRVRTDEGPTDEIFSRYLCWEFSPLLYSAERGDLANDFVPITEAEATRIVDRIRELAAREEYE